MAMPEELLIMIEEAAKAMYMSRAEYIRFVLRKEVVDPRSAKAKADALKANPWKLLHLDDS